MAHHVQTTDELTGRALTFVVRRDVGDVWPHKAGRPADGVHGPRVRESGQVRPHVGMSARQPRTFSIAMARGRKKGLAIPAVRVTMCDRLESRTYRWPRGREE
jgi:hypothetical protein